MPLYSPVLFRHLQVQWSYPGEDQGGNYSCEITGIDNTGHSTVFTKSIDVTVAEPSLSDLVGYLCVRVKCLVVNICVLDREKGYSLWHIWQTCLYKLF